MPIKTASMIGLGYIGLPTAAIIASKKIKVLGVDIDTAAVETINRGDIHIVEPGLGELVQSVVSSGFLRASLVPEESDVFLIAVPTPFLKDDAPIPRPDLSYIEAAAMAIAPVLKPGNLVILESTSPVGTTEQLAEWLAKARPDLKFPGQGNEKLDVNISYCPERVLPGNVLHELITNDRVIGGLTPSCTKSASKFYKSFINSKCLETNARTAEMVKLTENSCRDSQIAFANELSMICDELGIDVWELIELANHHPRINILNPGPGVGGHCIAVDPWFIVSGSPDTARLIKTAREVNNDKTNFVVNQIRQKLAKLNAADDRKKAVVAFYGLAFKADIDDTRESPAIKIVETISDSYEGEIWAVEPNIDEHPDFGNRIMLVSPSHAQERADLHVLLVDHKEFKGLRFGIDDNVIDTRGIWRESGVPSEENNS